jgi:selenoprotein W-related protein
MKPILTIEYCPRCGWLLRAAYMAQEFLVTFSGELGGVTLIPSEEGGKFCIMVGERLIFDRKDHGGFEEIPVLKQRVRDLVSPEKNLGHSDSKK